MNTLRRVTTDYSLSRDVLPNITGERVSIISLETDSISSLVEDYPFSNQSIFFGEFEYSQEEHPFDPEVTRTVRGKFSYRTESGLFMLRSYTDNPSPSEIVRELNSELPRGIKINIGLNLSRSQIWRFIEFADKKLNIQVLFKGETVEYEEVSENPSARRLKDHLVSKAKLIFEYQGERIHVLYLGDSMSISGRSDKGREYVLQLFEKEVLQKQ